MAKKITLTIQDMECPNCAMRLEGIEDKLAGVLRAEASYQKGLMTVEYNAGIEDRLRYLWKIAHCLSGLSPSVYHHILNAARKHWSTDLLIFIQTHGRYG